MKKILFIIAILATGLSYAQAPQITDAQLENSRIVKEKTEKFNAAVNEKVDQIMSLTNIDVNKRSELFELVLDNESQTAKIERENISDVMKQSKINDARDAFETQLKNFLGEKKYTMLQNAMNPK